MSEAKPSSTKRWPPQNAVELISPPLRLAILITLLITAGGIAWACLARIPIYVNGIAYLLWMGDIDGIPALTEGTVHYQFSSTQLIRRPLFSRLYRLIHDDSESADDTETTGLAREVLATHASGPKLALNTPYAGEVPKGQLLAWIDSPLDRNNLRNKLLFYDQARQTTLLEQLEARRLSIKINVKLALLGRQLAAETAFLNSIEGLRSKGYASMVNVLAQRSKVDSISAEIISQQQELVSNDQRALQAQALQRQALVDLRTELSSYAGRAFVFAEKPLYIVDLVIPQAAHIKLQEDVMNVANEKPGGLPDGIPGYLSQSDAEQVSPGMEVLVTPVGMDRAQFGGIIGKVADVSPLPSDLDQIAERTGSKAIAQEVTSLVQNPMRVDLVLQRNPQDREPRHGGFRWSSPGTPPFALILGNQLSLQITAQRIRPISLLIPSLLRLTGASPPTPAPRRLRSGTQLGSEGTP